MKTFRIYKKSGTYAELLEAYGVANLLQKIFDSLNELDVDITLSDHGYCYEVDSSKDITEQDIESLSYFQPIKFVKKKEEDAIPNGIGEYIDYPKQKQIHDLLKEEVTKIYSNTKLDQKEKQDAITHVRSKYPVVHEFDVYSQIIHPNNYPGFKNLHKNIARESFTSIIKTLLNNYAINDDRFSIDKKLRMSTSSVTAIQLYNPSLGKGVNRAKANGVDGGNIKYSWISETLKISGAISDMICQLIKVGSNYDLKIYVPEYKNVKSGFRASLIPEFKKRLKGNTPIKFDILCILSLTQILLENDEYSGRRRRVRDIINGLHSVYQKDLGQNKAVMNIGFLQLPGFVSISSKEDNLAWIDVLKEHSVIINSLDEDKGAYSGLLKYRDFISDADYNKFFEFIFWYSSYAMSMLSKGQWVALFSTESFNIIYSNMSNNSNKLMEIINNNGFQAIAKAIRKSTVSLQYTPKENRSFDIKYGVAQKLQVKSKCKEDLAEFIGEFIASYNAETARTAEKGSSQKDEVNAKRANVKVNELQEFYLLLDTYPSSLIGALLASYGFALEPKTEQE